MSESPSGLITRMRAAARAESQAAAQRLVAVAELVELRIAQDGGASELWALDVVDAVTVEVAAGLGISRGWAASHVRYAHALRVQLPVLGERFVAGDVDEDAFRAAVFRTGLITDADVLAEVDRHLAVLMPRWGALNRSQRGARIDTVIARVDADAVRRRRDRLAEREVYVGDVGDGLAEVSATVYATDAHAFADRLTALAATVCPDDPRTLAQRRADAIGALAAGADRLGCRCGSADCPAGGTAASPVVVHVIAERATVEGTGRRAGVMSGYDGLLPAELVADLSTSARLRPLIHPLDAPPEPGYVPSAALAAFVRARDLTCRAPGCDAPALGCDVDHTVPHGDGGATHASNLKCLCRFHHLLKTFWGWRDHQLADGTVIWEAPSGERYVTHPGGAVIFPGLAVPTAALPVTTATPAGRCTDKSAMMPRRTRTRSQHRAQAITAERRANHQRRTTTPTEPHVPDEHLAYEDTLTTTSDPDPPPF